MDAQTWSSPSVRARGYLNSSQPWGTRGTGYPYQEVSPQSRRRALAIACAVAALAFLGGEGLFKLADAAFRLLG